MVKLLMQWDIQPGREASYLEFVTQTFTPVSYTHLDVYKRQGLVREK